MQETLLIRLRIGIIGVSCECGIERPGSINHGVSNLMHVYIYIYIYNLGIFATCGSKQRLCSEYRRHKFVGD